VDSFARSRSGTRLAWPLLDRRARGWGGNIAWLATAGAILAVGGSAIAGCGGGAEASVAAKTPGGPQAEKYVHEKCASDHMESLDTNGDGKADIQRVLDGSGHELCRIVDLDHDGKPDMYEFFDGSGVIRRREFCYDESGAVNAIELYQGGKLAQREYDISGQRRIDTWDWFDVNAPVDAKTGRPAHPMRRERDTRGNGRVDQWWSWDGDKITIAVDRTGDGKPDPDATIVLAGPAAAAAAANPDAANPDNRSAAPDAGAPAAATPTGSVPAAASSSSSSGSNGGTP